MDIDKVIEWVRPLVTQDVKANIASYPAGIIVHADDLPVVFQTLYENPAAYFDMLSCVTGLDNGPAAGTMEVIYHFYSIPFGHSLSVKVILARDQPEVETATTFWKSANWLEREVYDMFGIRFRNHPDLRRILMPNDWEGYPLRKDYQHQETYRDIIVKY